MELSPELAAAFLAKAVDNTPSEISPTNVDSLPPLPTQDVPPPPPPVAYFVTEDGKPPDQHAEYVTMLADEADIFPPLPDTEMTPRPPQPEKKPAMDFQTDESSVNSFISGLLAGGPKQNKLARQPRQSKPRGLHEPDENGSSGESSGSRVRQQTRSSRSVDDDRLYDGTCLRADHHGYFVHRDYASHFFRWGWVARKCKPGFRILDVGCGIDTPLARVLSAPSVYHNARPDHVVCVDWNPVPRKFNPSWMTLHDSFDFNNRWAELITPKVNIDAEGNQVLSTDVNHFDLVSCLEVIEHMDQEAGDKLLEGIYNVLKPGGTAIISTPVFNGKKAANHIYEYSAQELYEKMLRAGFVLLERYGTFANLQDLKKVMPPGQWELCQLLRNWYGNDVISCFLAPLYPDSSRNNAWVIARKADYEAGLLAGYVPGAPEAFTEIEGEEDGGGEGEEG